MEYRFVILKIDLNRTDKFSEQSITEELKSYTDKGYRLNSWKIARIKQRGANFDKIYCILEKD